MTSLHGKVALVTGSSRGIGRAIAVELGRQGAAVAVNYLENQSRAKEAVEEIISGGQKAVALQADVAKFDDCQRLVAATIEGLGGLDILVNNAGVNRDKTLRRMTPEVWEEVMSANLNSVFNCSSSVLSHLIEVGGGHIVNISSVIGQMGNVGQSNYAATKAGIIGFTKAAALELVRYHVNVNAIAPGFIETDMVGTLSDEIRQALIARIPMGRFGTAEEVATLVRYLVTEGTYITGQCFEVNGGMYM